eukprot:GHVN01081404.1.p1 GENE.GHVN01081404.1~~GHVN01081404.1.p1  ORF type:complete len:493 (-),score=60.14 GHVN01081404.1:1418-2896(-)
MKALVMLVFWIILAQFSLRGGESVMRDAVFPHLHMQYAAALLPGFIALSNRTPTLNLRRRRFYLTTPHTRSRMQNLGSPVGVPHSFAMSHLEAEDDLPKDMMGLDTMEQLLSSTELTPEEANVVALVGSAFSQSAEIIGPPLIMAMAEENKEGIEARLRIAGKKILEVLQVSDQFSEISLDSAKLIEYGGGTDFSFAFAPHSLNQDGISINGASFGLFRSEQLSFGDDPPARRLVAAGLQLYSHSPRLYLAIRDVPHVHAFAQDKFDKTIWRHFKTLKEKQAHRTSPVAAGNLHLVKKMKGFSQLVDFWFENRYELIQGRDIVDDAIMISLEQQGSIVYPTDELNNNNTPFLHKALPIAYLVDKIGGRSSDGLTDILRLRSSSYLSSTSIASGEKQEVDRFDAIVGPATPTGGTAQSLKVSPPQQGSGKGIKIILANPRGFCEGVTRAINTVEQALRIWGPPIYVKHEIVHNRIVCDRLRVRDNRCDQCATV